MRNKLQYAYSISVLIGVLVTAYLMMNRTVDHGFVQRTQTPSFRMDAQAPDPAVSQLLEMESALRKLKAKEETDRERLPADLLIPISAD